MQEANEIKARKLTAPVDPRPFDWAPVASSAPAATTAPAQAEMSKGEPAAAPAATAAPATQ